VATARRSGRKRVGGRVATSVVVALGSLAVTAGGIAVSLVTSDQWPGWLQPYRRWGWWAVLTLGLITAGLAVWQARRQDSEHNGKSVAIARCRTASGLRAGMPSLWRANALRSDGQEIPSWLAAALTLPSCSASWKARLASARSTRNRLGCQSTQLGRTRLLEVSPVIAVRFSPSGWHGLKPTLAVASVWWR
jgi:hypothetical protein